MFAMSPIHLDLEVGRELKTSYIDSNSFDPWLNLAVEEYLLSSYAAEGVVLYLWQNAHTVVIGRNQNAWQECHVDKLAREGGKLARRLSGGGAVYHDLGNLNFTFLMPKRRYDLHCQLAVVVDAVKSLGIAAQFSGRNDILADGKKFSGNAFYHGKDTSYHHGTILLDVDMKKLSMYLNVSKSKIESKGIKSVVSRVVNLKELRSDLTIETMKKAMYMGFIEEYGQIDTILDFQEITSREGVKELYGKYSSGEWLFGNSPEFDFRIDNRFNWGGVEIGLNVKKGIVRDAIVYSDSMDLDFIHNLQESLKSIEFSQEGLLKTVATLQESVERNDLLEWLRTVEI